jgi:Ulp1 family protease
MASLLLTFEDVTIYSSDLECLAPQKWLNDQIISFGMARSEKAVSSSSTGFSVRFLDASLVACLRLQLGDEDEEEVLGFLEGMGLIDASAVIVPLTNKVDNDITSSHWSLVYIDLRTSFAMHFDSCHNSNREAAEVTIRDIYDILQRYPMYKIYK